MKLGRRVAPLALALLLAVTQYASGRENLLRVGVSQLQHLQYDQAIETFDHLLKTDPHNVFGQYYMGVAAEKKGDRKTALKYYQLAASNPSRSNPYLRGGKKVRVSEMAADAAVRLGREAP